MTEHEPKSLMNIAYIGGSSMATIAMYFLVKVIGKKYFRSSCCGFEIVSRDSSRGQSTPQAENV